jgi:hypothetical protein
MKPTGIQCFTVATEESIDVSDRAQLAGFVCGIDTDFGITEEFAAFTRMKETTTGADLYDEVMQFLNFSAEKVA